MMASKTLEIDQILSLLAEAPQRIAAATGALAPAQLRAAPEPEAWSANEVLAHLRSCADVWGDAIRTIAAGERTTIRAVNPRTWIRSTNYLALEFHPSFDTFAAQRAGLLAFLGALPAEAWMRSATVTGAGKPLERTVRFYAVWLAEHERAHVREIERIARAGG
jgi:hypothetical protein